MLIRMSSNSILLLNPVIYVIFLIVTFCFEPLENRMQINMKPAVLYSVIFSKIVHMKVAKLIPQSTRLNTVSERFSVLVHIWEHVFLIVGLQAAYPEMHFTLRSIFRRIMRKIGLTHPKRCHKITVRLWKGPYPMVEAPNLLAVCTSSFGVEVNIAGDVHLLLQPSSCYFS
jgi:hypothetical protein